KEDSTMRKTFLWGVLLLLPAIAMPAQTTAITTASHRTTQLLTGTEERVRHELVRLPYFSVFDNLTFQVQGDTVVLGGAVTRPTLKHDAEHVAKKVEGVDRVVNNIEVLPLSSMDDRIRMAELRAIYGDPLLS